MISGPLDPVRSALERLTDSDLASLIGAANAVPQMVPGLLAWIEHAAGWETQRRVDFDFPLQPPEAAIDPTEDAIAIAATIALRDVFASDSPRVAALFGALLDLLVGTGRRH